MNELGTLIGGIFDKLQVERKRGIQLPQDELRLVEPLFSGFLVKGQDNPFWAGEQQLNELETAKRADFQHQMGKFIQESIHPRLQ